MENVRMQDQDVIREFLAESHENLSRLDQELVELEQNPQDTALLASIFRTIHTIKGTCGFFAFSILERITHQAETLLSQLRDGKRELTPSLISLILETVDVTRTVLASIEAIGEEGTEQFEDLENRLRQAARMPAEDASSSAPASQPALPSEQQHASEYLTEPQAKEQANPLAGQHEINSSTDIPEASRPEESTVKSSAVADSNIRVGINLLDKLMDLVGELVLTRNQILQFNTDREDAALNATSQRLNLITTELQEGVMKTRMQPIGTVWNKLPRVVRDMAVSLGKQFHLEMEGAETELDRTIIEAIKDPLMHLVRNSCDHGIETPEVRARSGKSPQGRLTLRAYHEGGQVNIEISDDGAGIDVEMVKQKAVDKGLLRPEQAEKLSEREALNLIFLPGFSTAKSITNVSGRGVGMDVVKSNIEKIGGIVDISSRPGEGSTVKLKIPLTLAIIPGLVINSGGERFVIPQVSLLELIRLEGDSSDKRIEQVHGTPVYRRRGSLLPVAYLNKVLDLKSDEQNEAVNMVVLQAEDRQFGLIVDGINDTQEIVVKPLSKQLKGLSVYAGATIMGDGRVALILDVLGIGQSAGVVTESRDQGRAVAQSKAHAGIEKQRLLLFEAGSFRRLAVPLSLVARLEEFSNGSIERAGGAQVVQYRNRILPLVPLRAILEPGSSDNMQADPVQVIVFNDIAVNGVERSVGIVVDQIVDVVEEAVQVRQSSSRKGLLGSAVIGGKVTDFVDLNEIIQAASESWFQSACSGAAGKRIVVAEASAFARGLIRVSLDMAGYQVEEAGNLDEAIRVLNRQPADVVLAALNLPPSGAAALWAALRAREDWERIPIVALADTAAEANSFAALSSAAEFEDCQPKFDREALLGSVARLSSRKVPISAGTPPAATERELVGAGEGR
jgi:two-component system chemotaxis sensor kinase CheA